MSPINQKGDFHRTEAFLKGANQLNIQSTLSKYGERGARALEANTPIDSGETARSWGYQIIGSKGRYKLVWTNSHVVDGVPIAIILQYGHATRSGSYVSGRDYINPALKTILDELAQELWKEVTSL